MKAMVGFVVCLVFGSLLWGCLSARGSVCDTLTESARPTPRTMGLVRQVLLDVATTGEIADPCATHAAIEATRRWQIKDNVTLLRRIVGLQAIGLEEPSRRATRDDTIAHALHTLMLMKDNFVTELARSRIGSSAAIAGTAFMVLIAAEDWDSTNAIADRLIRDEDLRRNYSLAWSGLEFLVISPQQPSTGCAVLMRFNIFDAIPPGELRNPTIARIIAARSALNDRYGCALQRRQS